MGWLSIFDAVHIWNQNRRMKIGSENLFIPEAFKQKIMNVMDAVLACLLVFYGLSNGREVVIRKNTRLYGTWEGQYLHRYS